jgi:CCR4-NOT complex subunit CAF16
VNPVPAVSLRGLDFHYPGDARQVLHQVTLDVPSGARCLIVGANGAGKTTLLQVVAGRYMMDEHAVRVLGCPAFHDTTLSGRIELLGGTFPLDVDIGVHEILARHEGIDLERRDQLIRVLGVDTAWRMHRVSDGQRRRVQILLGLLKPRELYLCDEVTTDLDVLARVDLLTFLREESEKRGATLLYATHIFDGLADWATHLVHLSRGRVRLVAPIADIEELRTASLLRTVERWLRAHG